MALYATGTTILRNIGSWRVKETDRIAAMANELRKLGATVVEGADFIEVTAPETAGDWKAAHIHTYDDHRIAMCFSLAAFNPAKLPVRIADPRCVAKTFPDYFETLFSLALADASAIPVLCIDGPSASGKGTLADAVASHLGYHFLDSGALYRITGLAASRAGIALEPSNAERIVALLQSLTIRFEGSHVLVNNEDVSEAIRTETAGMHASAVSGYALVREALVEFQRSFRRLPGLVADGRDMGTAIFPAAQMKVYLTASAERRAERRYKQLISKGDSATLPLLCADLKARDFQDSSRSVSPLRAADDALLLDNSDMTVEQSVAQVLNWWQEKRGFAFT
jgi:3-phosphoshikimate 1-carboxyvinyltransferase